MEKLGLFLRDGADVLAKEIMQAWQEVGEREPWHRVPEHLDEDHLPDMIAALADAALLTFFSLEARQRLAWVATEHGQHRFLQGVAEQILGREYELLRWALWLRLKREAPSELASQAIIRLDSALTFAHGASLRGYHRGHIELSGEWPQAIVDYVDQWSFPS